jgi:HEPN domain-containing protein
MNRPLVIAEWRRAVDSLGAARSCRRDGFYADSVSRAYYAILHAAKAALQVQGITAESHAAVKRLFGLHLTAIRDYQPPRRQERQDEIALWGENNGTSDCPKKLFRVRR